MDGWFKGTVLLALLRDTLSLPRGPETDLLHAMDRWDSCFSHHLYLTYEDIICCVENCSGNLRLAFDIISFLNLIFDSSTESVRIQYGTHFD